MVHSDLGTVTSEELIAWDSFAAAAFIAISKKETLSSKAIAEKAAEAADHLLLQRRLRGEE